MAVRAAQLHGPVAGSAPPHPQVLPRRSSLPGHPTLWHARCPIRGACVPPRVPPSLKRDRPGAGMLTCSPSTTPCGLALGPTTPGWIILPQEPLDFRWQGFSPCFYATHTGILTSCRSTRVRTQASLLTGTLPYHVACTTSAASVVGLSPGTFSARDHWTSELLRTRSRVAASKPTSWLSSRSHILVH